jgi:phage protein D
VAGEEVAGLAEGLVNLLVVENTEGLFTCEACFGNWGTTGGETGFLYFGRDTLDFGAGLTIEMGDSASRAPIFDGVIMALEGRFHRSRAPDLMVLAEDRGQNLRMTRRSRTFEDIADSELFETIARDHGLRPEVDVDGTTHAVLAQLNQSDLAFLRERARAIDAEVWVEGDALFAQARSRRRAAAAVSLTYGQNLREIEVSADLANQRSAITVSGWDVGAKEAIVENATEKAIRGELGAGRSGAAILAEALGERADALVHTVPLSGSEAQERCKAEFRRMARRFVSGVAVAEGDARLKVATHVELAGLGPLFDGAYYVTEVAHSFDGKDGFRSRISVERPFLGGGR